MSADAVFVPPIIIICAHTHAVSIVYYQYKGITRPYPQWMTVSTFTVHTRQDITKDFRTNQVTMAYLPISWFYREYTTKKKD